MTEAGACGASCVSWRRRLPGSKLRGPAGCLAALQPPAQPATESPCTDCDTQAPALPHLGKPHAALAPVPRHPVHIQQRLQGLSLVGAGPCKAGPAVCGRGHERRVAERQRQPQRAQVREQLVAEAPACGHAQEGWDPAEGARRGGLALQQWLLARRSWRERRRARDARARSIPALPFVQPPLSPAVLQIAGHSLRPVGDVELRIEEGVRLPAEVVGQGGGPRLVQTKGTQDVSAECPGRLRGKKADEQYQATCRDQPASSHGCDLAPRRAASPVMEARSALLLRALSRCAVLALDFS